MREGQNLDDSPSLLESAAAGRAGQSMARQLGRDPRAWRHCLLLAPDQGEPSQEERRCSDDTEKPGRRRVELRRWHGPALRRTWKQLFSELLGPDHKVCALEHVRKGSSLEQISAGDWEEAIREVIDEAAKDRVAVDASWRPSPLVPGTPGSTAAPAFSEVLCRAVVSANVVEGEVFGRRGGGDRSTRP